MYGLTKFTSPSAHDPFAELARDFFGHRIRPASPSRQVAAFDFIESEEGYRLSGDLPGIPEEKLELTVHDGVLTISGSRDEETSEEGENFLVRERRFGSFSRRLNLPKDADAETVTAKLEHGVLTVHIGKRKELQARKIQIS